MSGKRTKNNDVCHCVTADAVATVDTTDHFTGGKRPWQHVVVIIQHAGFGVDGHATHSVMNARRNLNGVERPFVDRRTQRGGTAKVIIVLFFHKTVIAFQRRQELVVIHPQCFSQCFW